jgi:N-acylneuraminate cytidylyltransferase
MNRPRRQDIDANDRVYRENGSIYITKTQVFNKFKNRLSENNVGFLMSPEEGVDIDTQLDWDIAERILFKLVEENEI